MSKTQTQTQETSMGTIESIKEGQGEPWHIAHPWGDERFYGSVAEVKQRMTQITKINDNQEG